jgi:hypothetical protein
MIRETFDRVGDAMSWLTEEYSCDTFYLTEGNAIAAADSNDGPDEHGNMIACIYEPVGRSIEVEVYDR